MPNMGLICYLTFLVPKGVDELINSTNSYSWVPKRANQLSYKTCYKTRGITL